MRFHFIVPPTADQGSYKSSASVGRYETRAKAALADYNSARAHDGQPPLTRMPIGTVYESLTVAAMRDARMEMHIC